MTKVVVEPGICDFITVVEVKRLSAQRVRVVITSECEMVRKMNSELVEVDWQDVLKQPLDSLAYKSALQHINHVACPIPVAILKAIEVEVGAAAPKNITIRFETVDHSN